MTRKIFVIIFLIMVATGVGWFVVDNAKGDEISRNTKQLEANTAETVTLRENEGNQNSDIVIPLDWEWKEYKNIALGLAFEYPGYLEITKVHMPVTPLRKGNAAIRVAIPPDDKVRMIITLNPNEANFDLYVHDYRYSVQEEIDGMFSVLSDAIMVKNQDSRWELPDSIDQYDADVVIYFNTQHSSGREVIVGTRFPENESYDFESDFRIFAQSIKFDS